MPKKYKVILKSIGRKWFLILVIIIIIIFFINPVIAIWMTIITIVLYLLSYIPELFFSKKLMKFMHGFYSLDDKTIARKLKRPLAKIQEELFSLSQKQQKKGWLIIYLNKQYFFYNEKAIERFKEYYNMGLGEKEILEKLLNYNIETRSEVKAIEETLIKNNRLEERETTVKEFRERERFS
ncbi:MAG: hypothetical protein ACFE85_00950 [Candidatus Hodarchaeota archaeon]